VKTAAVSILSAAIPNFSIAAPKKDWRQVLLDRDRWLSLERAASGEKGQFRYYRQGSGFEREGYNIACHLLRDVEANVTYGMNPKLLDTLFLIQAWLRVNKLPFHIIIQSGYRTPAHNAKLAKAAKRSEHMKGNAADIRIPGLDTSALTRLAKAIGVGGVGFYPHNGFAHIDVGKVREWTG
jgi:uncharacterized protein YcbK (DUF882 family)